MPNRRSAFAARSLFMGLAHAVWARHFGMNVVNPALAQDGQN
jgi:hypothetical protein